MAPSPSAPRILVTGGKGQLGYELGQLCPEALVIDRDVLDITDAEAVRRLMEEHRFDVVINAAAYTAVDKAENDEAAAFAVNAEAPGILARACAETGAVLLHVSTDYVFDGNKSGAYREDDPVAPVGAYGRSKLAGEDAVRAILPRHAIVRTAWVYGVEGHNFVKTMLRVGAERPEVRVVADQHGCPTFARDLARTLLSMADRLYKAEAGDDGFGLFHYSGSEATTWHAFAEAIFKEATAYGGPHPEVIAIATEDYPTPAKRPANSVLDCSRIERIHGIKARPWRDALREMLAGHYKSPIITP